MATGGGGEGDLTHCIHLRLRWPLVALLKRGFSLPPTVPGCGTMAEAAAVPADVAPAAVAANLTAAGAADVGTGGTAGRDADSVSRSGAAVDTGTVVARGCDWQGPVHC